jgi:hypothetical protein
MHTSQSDAVPYFSVFVTDLPQPSHFVIEGFANCFLEEE